MILAMQGKEMARRGGPSEQEKKLYYQETMKIVTNSRLWSRRYRISGTCRYAPW